MMKNIIKLNKIAFVIAFILLTNSNAISQSILSADGVGDTYELINSVLAPNYNVVETPDCAHEDFGKHIDEVYDDVLEAYVFRFHIHVTPDNDRCQKFDRQRTEIKTYDKSPAATKGVIGEIVTYKWKFKLEADHQPSSSFTHIHQIKSVGADSDEESMPLITLTTRKKTPEKLELRYAATTAQSTLKDTELAPFKGVWLEATETILYGDDKNGTFSLVIRASAR